MNPLIFDEWHTDTSMECINVWYVLKIECKAKLSGSLSDFKLKLWVTAKILRASQALCAPIESFGGMRQPLGYHGVHCNQRVVGVTIKCNYRWSTIAFRLGIVQPVAQINDTQNDTIVVFLYTRNSSPGSLAPKSCLRQHWTCLNCQIY